MGRDFHLSWSLVAEAAIPNSKLQTPETLDFPLKLSLLKFNLDSVARSNIS